MTYLMSEMEAKQKGTDPESIMDQSDQQIFGGLNLTQERAIEDDTPNFQKLKDQQLIREYQDIINKQEVAAPTEKICKAKVKWSRKEDEELIKQHQLYQGNWKIISKNLRSDKSEKECKNRIQKLTNGQFND